MHIKRYPLLLCFLHIELSGLLLNENFHLYAIVVEYQITHHYIPRYTKVSCYLL